MATGTKWSYSRVGCFEQCPYKYKLRYIDKLTTIPDQEPNNALYLGLGLHKGVETTPEQGANEYKSKYYVANDAVINWSIQIEYWSKKVKELLPEGGIHEAEITDKNFIGFIDYIHDDTLYDFKFSNNIQNYLESPQLSIYKYFWEKQNPTKVIRHLKYVFIPKSNIRQKKTESIQQFRNRLYEELDKLHIEIVEIEYDPDSVTQFLEQCKRIEINTEYPKNPTRLCDWCEYREYCLDGEDYLLELPKNERRKPGTVTKRTIWLYGRPFTGKTTFADAAPDPLMLNTDGNIMYVTAPYISIKDEVTTVGRMVKRKYAWEIFEETIEELEKKGNTFKTIVIDLLEDMYESCRLYMYNKLNITHESDDNFRAWDKVRTRFFSTMRRFFNLDYENLIVISHEDASRDITKKSGENITSVKPNIPDKIATKIAGMVGLVGRVVADGDNRTIQFKADDVVFGGGRLKNIKETAIPLDWNELVRVFDESNENSNNNGRKK